MSDVKEQLIKLGATQRGLQKHIRPILAAIGKTAIPQMRGNLFPDMVDATQDLFDRYGYHTVVGDGRGSKDALQIFSMGGYEA